MGRSSTTSSGVQVPDKSVHPAGSSCTSPKGLPLLSQPNRVNDGKSVARRARVDSESEDIQGRNSLMSRAPQDTGHSQEAAPPFQVASIVHIPYILLMFLIDIIRMLARGVSGSSHRNNPERSANPPHEHSPMVNMAFGNNNKNAGNINRAFNTEITNNAN
ncbi:hypothetical protein L873DRAFT_1795664 [Choiromyces venosus 120613-1]|uniref:Uncharacterized protein n=1 Tax=Choiromyces venosus 120613-1 TaxID=1336337 RepID=A0A3N4IWC3_9PEZI|nr:hypothetical protein L873DRAFT_1795664 [Choiromyces venosus 120613-1]